MKIKVYVLPKHLDEKVAMLHLKKVGAKLTALSQKSKLTILVLKKKDHLKKILIDIKRLEEKLNEKRLFIYK